jgi:hypothetical protein
MVRIGISVEGPTEEHFVKTVLAPYLLCKGLFMQPVSIGGNVSIDRIKNEIGKLIYSFDYVTTLYDFYGFSKKTTTDTKQSLETQLLTSIKPQQQSKFIPYIQMYEFEGLLFSSPKAIATVLANSELEKWAQGVLNQFDGDPEKVNDSQQTAPSKRLIKKTRYRKTTHGPNIAAAIGIDKIRECCVGFNGWLTRLEALAN